MTDQKPDPADNTLSTDSAATPPEPEEVETAAQSPQEPEVPADAGPDGVTDEVETHAAQSAGADDAAAAEGTDEVEADEVVTDDAEAAPDDAEAAPDDAEAAPDDATVEGSAPEVVAETEAEAADAAAVGAAWTTTPVAPDPEATEAALAALAAKPEVTLEAPEAPPAPPGDEPPDEGTPVLLVGGILVGAFIVALAIVLILFRPFDNLNDVDASLAPSPVVTEVPSESPSAIASVGTPDFTGMALEEAEATATDYGLVVRVDPVLTDEEPPSTVLAQDPAAGEMVEEGSTIVLSVARPVPTNSVPDVSGLSEEDATRALEDAGFVVGDISQAFSDEVPSGRVISTDPAIDTELPQGSVIDIVISIGPESVAVPDLVDLSEADALDALDAAGLSAGDATEASDATIAAGNVISSDPAADAEVAPGTAVDYVLSTGPATVAVPDLVDLSEADALDALDAAGLSAGDATEASDATIAAGNVISSDPAADAEVAPGTAVDYVLSTGPATVAVPDLVDLSEADALDALDAAGLSAGDATEASDATIAAGNVVSSDPAADAEVAPGTAVDYVLSTGPATVAVPDLVDLSEADALDALDAAGLSAGDATEASDATIAAGNVISSDPAADAEVAPGTAVDYVLSTGPATVAVPDLVDLSEADALDALDAAGLSAGDATEASDATIAAGNVVSSDPAADAEVAPGTAVDYVLSTGPATVAVPDLVDLSEADALDALDAAGLSAGDATEASDATIAAGNVISSDPAADAEVAPGTAVDYVLSTGPATVAVPDLVGPQRGRRPRRHRRGRPQRRRRQRGLQRQHRRRQRHQPGSRGRRRGRARHRGQLRRVTRRPDRGRARPRRAAAADAPEAITSAGLTVGEASDGLQRQRRGRRRHQPGPRGRRRGRARHRRQLRRVARRPDRGRARPRGLPPPTPPRPSPAPASPSARPATAYSDSVAAGDVISQDPAAGAEVELGTAVSYVESLGVQTVAVPDLAGAAADAPEAITSAGLTVGEASTAYSDSVAAGDVISQDPAAGAEVELGTAVSYVESLGVQTVAVPDLAGAAADAPEAITSAGLTVGEASTAYSDSVAAGDVISQDPAAGTEVELGTAVSYVESLGVQTVAVPDLAGAAADAPEAITSAGLTVGEASTAYSDSVAAGDVISQDPAAGTEVELGTAVSYVESLGVQTVAVPDLAGAAADAPEAITSAGLTVGEASTAYSDSVAAGDVISQDPAAGAEVELGTAVSYVESLGVQTVAVPDLAGAAADAPEAITSAGLTVGEASTAYSDSVAAGDVISQDPAAGAEVELGTAVSYVESLGVQTVAVPDLAGAAADAPEAITSAGLTVGEASTAYSDSVAAGDVISQDPAAGAEVELGTAVSYVESLGVQTVAVPDLAGAAADAPEAITSAGLTVGEASTAYSDSVAAGDVISQDPAAGTEVELGTAVSYVESLGVQTVAVPDLAGAAADAPEAITSAGLTVGEASTAYSDSVAAGDVISQDPAAGTEVELGTAVSYVESLGVQTVAVPDLAGAAADAPEAITSAGLTVGEASTAYSDSVAAGDVISQDPAAGAEVELGTAVSYVESLGVQQVEVPEVRGQSQEDATAGIEAAGLTVAEVLERTNANVPAGEAVRTEPAAGESVDVGSGLTLTMSKGPKQVEVPDVVGMTAADAIAALEAAELTAGVASDEHSDTVPAGSVDQHQPRRWLLGRCQLGRRLPAQPWCRAGDRAPDRRPDGGRRPCRPRRRRAGRRHR